MTTRTKPNGDPRRRSSTSRARSNRRPTRRQANVPASIVRLTAGLLSLGYDELVSRLATLPREATSAKPTHSAIGPALNFADMAIGMALASTTRATQVLGHARSSGGGVISTIGRLAETPIVGPATRPIRTRFARYRAAAWRLAARGREEQLEGKRMMLHLIRDTASASVRDISASAIKQVSHSPDVAELVRTQSTDLASGTILEVRATSEQADDRIEGRVRSWLHLLRPGDAGTPSTTGGGPAA